MLVACLVCAVISFSEYIFLHPESFQLSFPRINQQARLRNARLRLLLYLGQGFGKALTWSTQCRSSWLHLWTLQWEEIRATDAGVMSLPALQRPKPSSNNTAWEGNDQGYSGDGLDPGTMATAGTSYKIEETPSLSHGVVHCCSIWLQENGVSIAMPNLIARGGWASISG